MVQKTRNSTNIRSEIRYDGNNSSQCDLSRTPILSVCVLASGAVDRRFVPWSGLTNGYKIGMCCFSSKHAALRKKTKDWLAVNQDNVCIRGLLFW
jgi:hypothetical protein